MSDGVTERLGELEAAVRRAGEAIAQLRDDNEKLRRELTRLTDERKQSLTQIDAILKDIAKLGLG
jgi:chromosome segregation ATPase